MAEPAWLEISLTVSGEIAEAVAEALSRYIEGGIVIEKADLDQPSGIETNKVRVFGYLAVDDRLEEARNSIEKALWHLGQIQTLPNPGYKFIKEKNWMEAWKEHYHPIKVGKQFLILPAGLKPAINNDRLIIRLEVGMAFGTGTHPSTQLSLELLERWVKPGDTLIDVGCGSGILSIGAAKLGAKKILAVDVDNEAVTLAQENIQLNQVGEVIELSAGSVEEINAGKFSVSKAQIVVANILSRILIKLIESGLMNLVTNDGTLILSGILEEGEEELIKFIHNAGFDIEDKSRDGDWIAIVSKRN